MKRVVAILITLVMLTFCGCGLEGKATVNSEELQEESMFVLVEDAGIFALFITVTQKLCTQ